MSEKPFKRGRRFYNDEQDRIIPRVKNVFLTGLALLKRRLQRRMDHTIVNKWVCPKPQLMSTSLTPQITWLGHSTFLIQYQGLTILTDPIFFEVSQFFFPRILQTPALASHFPMIDAILISHNHKDHLDKRTLKLFQHHEPQIFVPLGSKKMLDRWGFTDVYEKNWGDSVDIVSRRTGKACSLHFLPAYHWTGRTLFDINKSLWGSWMLVWDNFKIYFAGDTAYSTHFKSIGTQFGPIDVVLMPIGPDQPRDLVADVHVGAQEALQGFIELGAAHFVPMHWGTFRSGGDYFTDPLDLLIHLWKTQENVLTQKTLHIIKCGESCKLV